MRNTDLGRLRLIAILEGISYLLLLGIAMPLKYALGMPAAVRIVGMLHGILFVLFCGVLLNTTIALSWSIKRSATVFLSSIIPFGTFVMDKSLKAEEEARAKEDSNNPA